MDLKARKFCKMVREELEAGVAHEDEAVTVGWLLGRKRAQSVNNGGGQGVSAAVAGAPEDVKPGGGPTPV